MPSKLQEPPTPQEMPQPPQLFTSGATHSTPSGPPQLSRPSAQRHVPPSQVPPLHWNPQAPQLSTSIIVSTHTASSPTLQRSSPAAHSQAPATQVPVPQERPHAPQFVAEVWRFVSQPFVPSRSQSSKLALQFNVKQRPLAHTASLTLFTKQLSPQPPQLFGSVAVLVSQRKPSSATHSAVPGAHAQTAGASSMAPSQSSSLPLQLSAASGERPASMSLQSPAEPT